MRRNLDTNIKVSVNKENFSNSFKEICKKLRQPDILITLTKTKNVSMQSITKYNHNITKDFRKGQCFHLIARFELTSINQSRRIARILGCRRGCRCIKCLSLKYVFSLFNIIFQTSSLFAQLRRQKQIKRPS